MADVFVPSRYISFSATEDDTLVLYNSLTGALGAVPAEQVPIVRNALRRSARHPAPLQGVLSDLYEGGFLVPEGTDEQAIAHRQFLARYTDEHLNLIILPTEQCNFRCVYCYEAFIQGKMPEQVRHGIRRLVASQSRLRQLDIAFFGGEPLLAADVVIELSRFFHEHCAERGIEYTAGCTTNASLLTPDVVEQLIPLGVNHFQITIDGVQEEHDKRRVLQHGGGTFDMILANLRYLHTTNHLFSIILRHNYDAQSVERLDEFVDMLQREFGGDPRFSTLFFPIGQWGGENDSDLSTCERRASIDALIRGRQLALKAGFRRALQFDRFQPNGYVCYAANPRSFVIGSDGRLYKCTVELDYHDRNIVGRLNEDGTMELDWRKMALWCETNGLDEGKKCSSCFFSPSCHGACCPKEWMDSHECQCPQEKVAIRQVLPLIFKESQLPQPTAMLDSMSHCVK